MPNYFAFLSKTATFALYFKHFGTETTTAVFRSSLFSKINHEQNQHKVQDFKKILITIIDVIEAVSNSFDPHIIAVR